MNFKLDELWMSQAFQCIYNKKYAEWWRIVTVKHMLHSTTTALFYILLAFMFNTERFHHSASDTLFVSHSLNGLYKRFFAQQFLTFPSSASFSVKNESFFNFFLFWIIHVHISSSYSYCNYQILSRPLSCCWRGHLSMRRKMTSHNGDISYRIKKLGSV